MNVSCGLTNVTDRRQDIITIIKDIITAIKRPHIVNVIVDIMRLLDLMPIMLQVAA